MVASLSENDFDLMRRLQAGDRSALSPLYDRYTPLVYPVLLRILAERADADDALQETWVQAWRTAPSYDLNRGTVAAWLVAVARTRALDRVRSATSRRRGETAAEVETSVGVTDDPLAAPEHRQLSERVRRALGALEPKHRRVLECAYFDGLSQAEIATRLNAPVGTVKSWTRQALTRLRNLLPGEEWA
jgi:RNA polymerase sigma-70 factor (ECF subfamily)